MENLESKVIMENLTPEFVQKVAASSTVRWRTFWTSQNRRLRNLAC